MHADRLEFDGISAGHPAGSALQLVLTVAAAVGAAWAAVSLADRDSSPSGREAAVPAVAAPAPASHEFGVSAAPFESAYFFIVGSEEERATLIAHLEAEALIRAVVDQPPRSAWVAIAATDEQADAIRDAVNQDAALRAGGAAPAIDVVDARK